jgi:tetratricopeptide (TPR) repeat protein
MLLSSAVIAVAAGTGSLPVVVHAQLAAPRVQTVLVLTPLPSTPDDSAFAVGLGDAIRKRLDGKMRLKLRVIDKKKISEALVNSGFTADALLDANGAEQLAKFINTDAYITGSFKRNSAPVIALRLVDERRSGLSGWVTVNGPGGATAEDLAEIVVDSLDTAVKAAEHARDCQDRRDKQELGSARDRAERAFGVMPSHPGAAMCAAQVFETTKQVDSVVAMLEKAVAGDSLWGRAWDMLGRYYQQANDTLKAAEAFGRNLATNPTDTRLRLQVVALYYQAKKFDIAQQLLEEGLNRNPGELQFLQPLERICLDAKNWPCALKTIAAEFEADPALAQDTLFFAKVIGVSQAVPDTQAMVHWTGEAVKRYPSNVAFWRGRAAAFKTRGWGDSAVAAYQKLAELDPTDVASPIAAAQLILEGVKIDSTIPLDTAALRTADALLTRVAAGTSDEGMKTNVALLYFQPATKMIQSRVRLDIATGFLEKSLANDVKKQLATQTQFFLGLAYFFLMTQQFDNTAIQALNKNKDCTALGQLEAAVNRVKTAMTAGASVQQQTATQILTGVGGYEKFIPQAKKAYKCT